MNRELMLLIVIWIVLLTLGCASVAPKTRAVYQAPKVSGVIHIKTAHVNDDSLNTNLEAAISYWNVLCDRRVFRYTRDSSPVLVIAVWDPKVKAMGEVFMAHPDIHVIRLNPKMQGDEVVLQTVLRHELGHLIGGAGHHPGDDLMDPYIVDHVGLFPGQLNAKHVANYCSGDGKGVYKNER